MLVTFDSTTEPLENLRREAELFDRVEARDSAELLRFWIDSQCLVKGNARVAKYGWYHEELAKSLGVGVVERATGGGVVFHDVGNLNWSFFLRNSDRLLSPTQMFQDTSRHIVRALVDLGVPAHFAPPNRIDAGGYKVSGLAARSTPKTRLVHGTLLVDSNLKLLNTLCIPPVGCPPVANINRWTGPIKTESVIRAVVKALKAADVSVTLDHTTLSAASRA